MAEARSLWRNSGIVQYFAEFTAPFCSSHRQPLDIESRHSCLFLKPLARSERVLFKFTLEKWKYFHFEVYPLGEKKSLPKKIRLCARCLGLSRNWVWKNARNPYDIVMFFNGDGALHHYILPVHQYLWNLPRWSSLKDPSRSTPLAQFKVYSFCNFVMESGDTAHLGSFVNIRNDVELLIWQIFVLYIWLSCYRLDCFLLVKMTSWK